MCFKSTRHGAFFPLWRYNARVYKVVILVELTRPSPSSSRVRSARVVAAIDEMLHRTLTSSLQPNGTFTTVPTFFSSKADDFYFSGFVFCRQLGFGMQRSGSGPNVAFKNLRPFSVRSKLNLLGRRSNRMSPKWRCNPIRSELPVDFDRWGFLRGSGSRRPPGSHMMPCAPTLVSSSFA
jgi:hypothetical protein